MLRKLLPFAAAIALTTQAFAGQVVLKWGDTQGPTHIAVQMIDRIAKCVAEKTDNRVIIQNYPGGQMGGSHEMIEAVSLGMLEIVTEGCANFGQYVPAIGIMESSYVWRDADHLVKTMSSPIGQEFNQKLIDKAGIRILGTTYYGSRHLTTTNKEVRGLADMQGLKVRVPENEVFLEMIKAWGGKPTPMTFNELYLALKQNVVDGQENPLPTIEAAKFYEVQKYLVLTGHIITPRLVAMNEATFQKIAKEDQKVLQDCVAEGIAWNNEQIQKREAELVDGLAKLGMTVIKVNVDEFRKPILEKLPAMFEAKWGKGMWDRIQAVK